MPDMATKRSQAGWTTVAFGDVVRQVKDKVDPEASGLERYVAGEHMDTDDLRIRRWGEIGDGYLGPAFHMRFRPGQVLYGSRRTYLRKVAVADFEGITANTTYVLESANPDVLLPELLPFIMQTEAFNQHSVRESKGSVNPYVNFSDLAWFEFALPPIEEQRRLARVLVAAELARNSLNQLTETMRALRQSVVDHCSAVINESTRVGDNCQMQNGRPFPGDEYCDDGVPLLRPGNLDADGRFDWRDSKTKRVPARYAEEAAEFLVNRGDIVINLTAQSLEDGFMGRVCMATNDEPCLLNQRIGRFTDFSDAILPEFFFRCLQSSRFIAHAKSMCEGSKIKHLFWPHIACFSLPKLSLPAQAAACTRLRTLDQQIIDSWLRSSDAASIKSRVLRSAVQDLGSEIA